MDSKFADEIAKVCISHYESLPKKGKPVPDKEWTLLSAIVMTLNDKNIVVSLATGTKCIGRSAMSPRGNVVNDSHAEVLARRCFLRYLYNEIKKFRSCFTSEIILSTNENNQFVLNPDIKFHFFTSHVPCGDASIIPKIKRKGSVNVCIQDLPKRQKNENHAILKDGLSDFSDVGKFVMDLEDCVGEVVDIHRTGAKCLTGEPSYDVVRIVRTKPGRGDPTLSVSCSDKLARWISCGLQGALLSLLLAEPVRLSSVVVGGGGPHCPTVLRRALLDRIRPPQPQPHPHLPTLLHSSVVFPHSRYNQGSSASPCPSAVLWSRLTYGSHRPLEVCVEGRRQGVTKKNLNKGQLMVCKMELFREFKYIVGSRFGENLKYSDYKKLAEQYNSASTQTKSLLGGWTKKPQDLEDFT